QGEALRQHSRRRPELAEVFPMRGDVAGLLLELALRAGHGIFTRLLVADQPGGHFQTAPADRHAVLLYEDDVAGVDGKNHRGADSPGARGVLPPPAAPGLDETAGPFDLFGAI